MSYIHIFVVCPLAGHRDSLYLHLGIFAPALVSCFPSVIFVSLCPKIQLSAYVLPSVFASPSYSLYSSLTRLHLDMDLHISQPPTSFHSLQYIYCPQSDSSSTWAVGIFQTLPVVWKESCFSFALWLYFCLSLVVVERELPFFFFFFLLGALGILKMQITKQTNIHKCVCKLRDICVSLYTLWIKHSILVLLRNFLLCSPSAVCRRTGAHKSVINIQVDRWIEADR